MHIAPRAVSFDDDDRTSRSHNYDGEGGGDGGDGGDGGGGGGGGGGGRGRSGGQGRSAGLDTRPAGAAARVEEAALSAKRRGAALVPKARAGGGWVRVASLGEGVQPPSSRISQTPTTPLRTGTPEADFGWLRSDSHALRLQLLRMKYQPKSGAD
jgi:hypothetical protein